MNLNSLLIRIILLLLPGAISYKLNRKLIRDKNQKDWEDFLDILLFSLISYLLLGLFLYVLNCFFGCDFIFSNILLPLYDETVPINLPYIAFASFFSILIALVSAFVYNKKYITKFGQTFKITKKYGEEDVWDYFLNMKETLWVVIKDFKAERTYFGYIAAFSESGSTRELLMKDVDVYTFDGKRMEPLQVLYLAREPTDINIDIYDYKKNSKEDNSK